MTLEPYYWLNKKSLDFISSDYLVNQTTQERVKVIGDKAEAILKIKGFSEKVQRNIALGYSSLSTPIWANFGTNRGLPISCNGSYIGDNMESILSKLAEIGMMTKYGAGTSAYFGDLRHRGSPISCGGSSYGPVHFMELYNSMMKVVSQSSIRRGVMAAYLPIDHPDIDEFLSIRGDQQKKKFLQKCPKCHDQFMAEIDSNEGIHDLSMGVCVSDDFMKRLINGDKQAAKTWVKVIQKRFETGYPYIFFSDTVNKNAPQVYKDKGMKIHASNVCSEICLSSDENNSFVCNLSSMNLDRYDDWKDTDAVETMIYLLDAVMSEYIEKTEKLPFMKAANNFAKTQRALGLGVLGWHSYLQQKRIPFESMTAKKLNVEIHKLIRERCNQATEELAKKYGEPELLKGYGRRNTTVMAVAPTLSSSFILGQVSSGIEPILANFFNKSTPKGNFTWKNPYLKEVLHAYKKDNKETWESILKAGGSVAHLSFLSEEEINVFKTFGEISQMEIVIQASQRQKYIDQAQSLNLCIHHATPVKEVNKLMIQAWELGVKTLYYQRGTSPVQEYNRKLMSCSSCEG